MGLTKLMRRLKADTSGNALLLVAMGAPVLFGTAGLKILGSKDAQKVYAHTTAAALRAKDSVMKAVTTIRESAEDVYADAQDINEARAEKAAEAVIADAPAEG